MDEQWKKYDELCKDRELLLSILTSQEVDEVKCKFRQRGVEISDDDIECLGEWIKSTVEKGKILEYSMFDKSKDSKTFRMFSDIVRNLSRDADNYQDRYMGNTCKKIRELHEEVRRIGEERSIDGIIYESSSIWWTDIRRRMNSESLGDDMDVCGV